MPCPPTRAPGRPRATPDAARRGRGRSAPTHGWPLVLKTARGGYDGKGVWPVDDLAAVAAVVEPLAGRLLVEEMVPLEAELAVMVARRPSGETVAWPAVETAQVDGVCREVLVPGRLAADVVDRGHARSGSGWPRSPGRSACWRSSSSGPAASLLVNEIAARPHNSGHWTIEGAVTSQFENHLRAVLDLPLGSTAPQHAQVASVNVFGGAEGRIRLRCCRWPGRRGGPCPPVWQRGQARAQTGTRDRLRRRCRRRAGARLGGRLRPGHAPPGRARTCRTGRPDDRPAARWWRW